MSQAPGVAVVRENLFAAAALPILFSSTGRYRVCCSLYTSGTLVNDNLQIQILAGVGSGKPTFSGGSSAGSIIDTPSPTSYEGIYLPTGSGGITLGGGIVLSQTLLDTGLQGVDGPSFNLSWESVVNLGGIPGQASLFAVEANFVPDVHHIGATLSWNWFTFSAEELPV
jgi:hypothetical protein